MTDRVGKILIIGSGGLAREFAAWFGDHFEICGFSSQAPEEHASFALPGRWFDPEVTPEQAGTDQAVVAIGSPALKQALHTALRQRGFKLPTVVHPSSIVADSASLGEGVLISPHCVVAAEVALGALTYLNFGCGIGHDTLIGAYSQVNPGAQVAGLVRLGEQVLVGSGASIIERVEVGAGATIASGAAVFSSVAAGTTMMGNPARRMRAFEKDS